MIAVSIVSHGHGAMVEALISRLLELPEVAQVILTLNLRESLTLPADQRLTLVKNDRPKGFGANHNAAFSLSRQPLFCCMNPDISLPDNPFPVLLATLERFPCAALVAPAVRSPRGDLEDSARHFPTLGSLLSKALGRGDGRYMITTDQGIMFPDWVAGMFMLFRRGDFSTLQGFDDRFFLYYEDVDICFRCWRQGLPVVVAQDVSVIHDARRDSHRKLSYMVLHLRSMARYFLKHRGGGGRD
ncbi:hypothetical protein SAMN05421693_10957 [Ectothiorhodospira magna]|uniref:Glycosyltransferase 2-like domain-containing protein n=1 Tax=Ectothiorhodospira magna TaxID=867345 RepID=A0A1H9BJX9_9GAMM|nr:glycosyltransferase [Ectothiorhodospira magna]SEP89199.1 hypothetical protein SAMN05421693_10957 [Ectothiorhodospira magna]